MNRVLSAAVAAAFAVAAPAVFAETLEAASEAPIVVAAAGPAADTAGTPRGAPERRAFRSASERIEARLAYIRTALKITDAQNAQGESFANVLRKHAKDRDQRMEAFRAKFAQGGAGPGMQRGERPQFSAIDRMEFMQKRMQERSARLGEVISAAKPLYATFSPEQKQIADEMLSRQGRGGHHRGGPGGGMHRGMHRGS
jgi:hypothetical protein